MFLTSFLREFDGILAFQASLWWLSLIHPFNWKRSNSIGILMRMCTILNKIWCWWIRWINVRTSTILLFRLTDFVVLSSDGMSAVPNYTSRTGLCFDGTTAIITLLAWDVDARQAQRIQLQHHHTCVLTFCLSMSRLCRTTGRSVSRAVNRRSRDGGDE